MKKQRSGRVRVCPEQAIPPSGAVACIRTARERMKIEWKGGGPLRQPSLGIKGGKGAEIPWGIGSETLVPV